MGDTSADLRKLAAHLSCINALEMTFLDIRNELVRIAAQSDAAEDSIWQLVPPDVMRVASQEAADDRLQNAFENFYSENCRSPNDDEELLLRKQAGY